jgi:Kef-type K+ transport system membrane component KefB
MTEGFFELTIILIAAAVLSIIARMLRQPTILAYLAVGVLINYLNLFDFHSFNLFELFSDLGIMLLLFLVGLEINYSSLKMVGKVSLILGLGQVIFTSIGGFIISRFFGFEIIEAAYLAVGLCFSSTIIIVKLLTDKKDLNSLYGKISIGFLLVQDLVAVLLLVLLSSMQSSGEFVPMDLLIALGKAVALFGVMLWLGRKIMPVIFDKVAHSQEILFVTSLAWVFVLAVLVNQINFSIEIAGFLAGIALANSSEHFQIANRVRPLRDFFIMLFFVSLGTSFVFEDLSGLATPILTFSAYVLIGNPLIVMVLMGILGYRKRTGFLTGLTVAQISEFSLILMAVGLKLGHIDDTIIALVTAIGIVTIITSTYLITHGNQIYRIFSNILSIFERRKLKEPSFKTNQYKKSIVLIGYHRTGKSLAHHLNKEDLLVIDFDPSSIPSLENNGYDYILGDISDEEVFEASNCAKSKLVISTSPDQEDNLLLLHRLKKLKKRPQAIFRAETAEEATTMYEHGADYVLLPHLSSGHTLGQTLSKSVSQNILKKLKHKDLLILASSARH